jgi:hypothetical protein
MLPGIYDQTMEFGHVGVHPQSDLPLVLQQFPRRGSKTESSMDLEKQPSRVSFLVAQWLIAIA